MGFRQRDLVNVYPANAKLGIAVARRPAFKRIERRQPRLLMTVSSSGPAPRVVEVRFALDGTAQTSFIGGCSTRIIGCERFRARLSGP